MATSETPEYMVQKVEQSTGWFAAPNLIPNGSIVRTDAPFGPHFAPLNDAAMAKMQAWLDEEHPAADKEGRPLFNADGSPKKWKPHRQTQFGAGPATDPFTVEVVSAPSKLDGPKLQTLAEIQAQGPGGGSTDQRPGPQPYSGLPPRTPSAPVELKNEEGESIAEVVAVGPPATTVSRKV